MPELVTIGETMVVFDSASAGPLRYASSYTCHTGGAETTVAVEWSARATPRAG